MSDLRDRLRELESECKGNDDSALYSQIEYTINLYYEIERMKTGVFHGYENKIFEAALPIFIRHLICQIETILRIKDLSDFVNVEHKRELLEDVQNAVGKMVEIYQSIAGSINNVEQPVFPVMRPNMYVFNASLKILSYYSELLNRASDLFEKDTYAFLLYPSVSDIIKTEILFKKREERGKVIVVTFPEKRVNHPEVIPILFHEAFHVIERNMRKRALRAECLIKCMAYTLAFYLFKNVSFTDNKARDERIKDNLINKWFGGLFGNMSKEIKAIENPEDDRTLYAQNVVENIVEKIVKKLIEVEPGMVNDIISMAVREISAEESKIESAGEYSEIARKLKEQAAAFKRNYFEILANGLMSRYGNAYIYIFREGYADVASCLFLNLFPQDYDLAFESSEEFGFKADGFIDRERLFRQYIVCEAVACVKQKEEKKKWTERAKEHYEVLCKPIKKQKFLNDEREMGCNVKFGSFEIPLDENLCSFFSGYLSAVAEELSDGFGKMKEVREFQDLMEKIRTNRGEVILNMLSG